MGVVVRKDDKAFYSVEARVERWLSMGTVKVFGSVWTPEPEVKFARVEDVQPFVDKVLAHIGCTRPIKVRRRRGAAMAHYHHGEIAIPAPEIGGTWALREWVVLHEIAHHLARGDGHGPAYARAFIDLLAATGHPTTSRLLEIACYEGGRPVNPPA